MAAIRNPEMPAAAATHTYVSCFVCIIASLRRLGLSAAIELIGGWSAQVRLCRLNGICLRICCRLGLHGVTMCAYLRRLVWP